MPVLPPDEAKIDFTLPLVIIGGGACGLTAALAARDSGVEALVVERDPAPMGTTAMSTGLIPACNTAQQRAAGIDDSPELFAEDIQKKASGGADPTVVRALTEDSGRLVDWLTESHDVPLTLVTGFLYPGHSRLRMHGSPHRTGGELMGALASACERAGADILTQARVTDLFADADGHVHGIRLERPGGGIEDIGCEALILACCGFGGNATMVRELIPEIAEATFHGHPGNKGDAILWGRELGAALGDLDAYQGHGGLAHGRGIPILWPLIMEGGFQVNAEGRRFSNEARGYSEQAVDVVAQPGHVAWSLYDQRLHELMLQFDDYHDALKADALISADTPAALAGKAGLPAEALAATIEEVRHLAQQGGTDSFGRSFSGIQPLQAPYYAVKVTGALFHTQGGLEVDREARVRREAGGVFPNLFAGGGAARGISGAGASGYMAGNGLLSAAGLGRLAGRAAARQLGSP